MQAATKKHPKVIFVSYTHEGPAHNEWVVALAARLSARGRQDETQMVVICDQDKGFLGYDINRHIRESVEKADVYLAIVTPEYKRKIERFVGYIAQEYSLILDELRREVTPPKKCIPILRKGIWPDDAPRELGWLKMMDMRGFVPSEDEVDDLVKSIFGVSAGAGSGERDGRTGSGTGASPGEAKAWTQSRNEFYVGAGYTAGLAFVMRGDDPDPHDGVIHQGDEPGREHTDEEHEGHEEHEVPDDATDDDGNTTNVAADEHDDHGLAADDGLDGMDDLGDRDMGGLFGDIF